MQNVYIFNDIVIRIILRTFGTFCVDVVHFFRFWYRMPRKIWQPFVSAHLFLHLPLDSLTWFRWLGQNTFYLLKNSVTGLG
jgi:hypothetical protein